MELTISKNNSIKELASGLKTSSKRKSAYASLLSLLAISDYLIGQGLNVDDYNLCSNPTLLESFELADIKSNGVKLEVRVIMNEDQKQVWLPKFNIKNGLIPDIYIVFKVKKDLSSGEIIGFIESDSIDNAIGNDKYYFVSTDNLKDPSELDHAIRAKAQSVKYFTEEDHNTAKSLFTAYIDDEISANDKKSLLNHLYSCSKCCNSFNRLMAFEHSFNNPSNRSMIAGYFNGEEDYTLKVFTGDIPVKKEEVVIPIDDPEISDLEEFEEPNILLEEPEILTGIEEDLPTPEEKPNIEERSYSPEPVYAENEPENSGEEEGLFKKIADKIREEEASSDDLKVDDLLANLDNIEVVSNIEKSEKDPEVSTDTETIDGIRTIDQLPKAAIIAGIAIIVGVFGVGINICSHLISKKAPTTTQTNAPNSLPGGNQAKPDSATTSPDVQQTANSGQSATPEQTAAALNSSTKPVKRDINNVLATAFTQGAGITISNISWEVGLSLASDPAFKNYLMITGQALKMALSKNLLAVTDSATNDKIKIKVVLDPHGSILSNTISQSSGSKQVDDIVLQTLKETFNYTKLPKLKTNKPSIQLDAIISL